MDPCTRLTPFRTQESLFGQRRLLIQRDGAAGSAVATSDLDGREQEIRAFRQVPDVGEELHAGHAFAAECPVRPQRPPTAATPGLGQTRSGVHPGGKFVASIPSPEYDGLEDSKPRPRKASIWE